jgi:hypothetical protein
MRKSQKEVHEVHSTFCFISLGGELVIFHMFTKFTMFTKCTRFGVNVFKFVKEPVPALAGLPWGIVLPVLPVATVLLVLSHFGLRVNNYLIFLRRRT